MKYLVLFLIPVALIAGTMTKTFTFSPYEMTMTKVNDYDLISLPGQLYTSEIGNPCLPEANYTVLLPPTAEVTSIEVVSYKVKDLAGSFNVFPAQPPLPLSQINEGTPMTLPNPDIYNSANAYPARLASFTPTGCMSGYRLAGISLSFPVHSERAPAKALLRDYRKGGL